MDRSLAPITSHLNYDVSFLEAAQLQPLLLPSIKQTLLTFIFLVYNFHCFMSQFKTFNSPLV